MIIFDIHTIQGITTLAQLPTECEQEMREIRAELHNTWYSNDAWNILLVNADGTRYFKAKRCNDFYGAGCQNGWWQVNYGKILWRFERTENPFCQEFTPKWVRSKCFAKSKNGTEIPKCVHTKQEVIDLARKIGIFDI